MIGAYSISKAELILRTLALAQELGPFGIRTTALAPGRGRTDFNAARWQSPVPAEAVTACTPIGPLEEPRMMSARRPSCHHPLRPASAAA